MAVRLFIGLFLLVSSIASAQTAAIIYFPFNSSSLTSQAKADLNRLIKSKKLDGVGLFGHTDQVGSEGYNEWLSLQRARAVRDYLDGKGVGEDRIVVVLGFGAKRLVSPDQDEMSRQLNRRVVIMNNYTPTALDKEIASAQALLTSEPGKEVDEPTVEPRPEATPVREKPVVKLQKNEKLVEDIKDKATKAGEHIVLKNINFHPGRNVFLESAFPALQDLLDAMQKIPTLKVEIQGHVCCTEDETDALDIATNIHNLSMTRAQAVFDYLVKQGIDKSRISYKGLARQYPFVKVETTEADRIANRRVEIKIVSK